uniref:Uncharacterized protein n=1 Tax=Tanacetum cinerariifolium TaxID=118510 RepID=A0A699IUX9_TANCI|nr:hypothetical protein [Tanacetum cinerariifolium]
MCGMWHGDYLFSVGKVLLLLLPLFVLIPLHPKVQVVLDTLCQSEILEYVVPKMDHPYRFLSKGIASVEGLVRKKVTDRVGIYRGEKKGVGILR